MNGTHKKDDLQVAMEVIGGTKLVFKSEELGTHFINLGASMDMYLKKLPVYKSLL